MEELAEVVSSLEDCLEWKEGKPPRMRKGPDPIDVQPPRCQTPRRRRDASAERHLAEAREVHQRALVNAATLEEEIK